MQSILSQALHDEHSNLAVLTATFELGGQKILVGSRPLTPADFTAINKGLPVTFQNDPTQFDGQINMLVRKVRLVDEEGEISTEKAFSVKDRPVLQRMPVDIVSKMFTDLFGSQLSDDMFDETGEPSASEVDSAKGNS